MHELAMLTQVYTGCITAKMLSIKLWLEKVYRKQLVTSAIRKDLLQIDGLYSRICKLRYELYDLEKRTDLNCVTWRVRMKGRD